MPKLPSLKSAHISLWLNPTEHSKFHNTSNHPPPATDSGRTARTPLVLTSSPLTPSHPFFPVPDRGTSEGRYVHVKHSDLTWPRLLQGVMLSLFSPFLINCKYHRLVSNKLLKFYIKTICIIKHMLIYMHTQIHSQYTHTTQQNTHIIYYTQHTKHSHHIKKTHSQCTYKHAEIPW